MSPSSNCEFVERITSNFNSPKYFNSTSLFGLHPILTICPFSNEDVSTNLDEKNVETNACEFLSSSQNSLKFLLPTNLDKMSRVAMRGVGLRLTYPHNLFKVEDDMSSPVSISITTERDSKSVDVATLRPYFFSTSDSKNRSSGMFLFDIG